MKPITSGVSSATCALGGRFHSGIGGRSAADCAAAAARGKFSTIGKLVAGVDGLYFG